MGGAHDALLVGALLIAGLSGCADVSYQQIQLGQPRERCDGAFPPDSTRSTDIGLCHYEKDTFGRTDAVVILFSLDRRIAAKIQATRFERDYGVRVDRGFVLAGQLDPQLYGTAQTGPIDTLRAVAMALEEHRGEKLIADGHALVAAGLVRLLQRWPGVGDIGIAPQRLAELDPLAPAGGGAQIGFDQQGVLRFEYRRGVTR